MLWPIGVQAGIDGWTARKFSAMGAQPSPSRTVFFEKPPGLTHSDAMKSLQLWLDRQKIEPSGFKITAWGRIGFELTFSRERDAAAAELFQWPAA